MLLSLWRNVLAYGRRPVARSPLRATQQFMSTGKGRSKKKKSIKLEADETENLNKLKRVCVVGTGPAGFYFAKYLLREHPTVQIDLLDALPHPFGLVRTGVAPDHQHVKAVQKDFEDTVAASEGRISFLGNIKVGEDIEVDELRSMYNAVVLACGAQSDRLMGIPGENLRHSFTARQFVNWYNGHPDYRGKMLCYSGETICRSFSSL